MRARVSAPLLALVCGLSLQTTARAEIPQPFRGGAAFLKAAHMVICSDFAQISAQRFTRFLAGTPLPPSALQITQGPFAPPQADSFNVLVVISDAQPDAATLHCAQATVPYDGQVSDEIAQTLGQLGMPFAHPDPKIAAMLGDTRLTTGYHYHKPLNWITVVIGVDAPSNGLLNDAMSGVFDQPAMACASNQGCLPQP